MAQEFRDDPQHPGERVWRRSAWGAVGSGTVLVLCVVLGAAMTIALAITFANGALHGLAQQLGGAALVLGIGGAMTALSSLLWRDMRGKRAQAIRLSNAGLTLHLPAGRSLIHNPPGCSETVPWSDVTAIETRLEAYVSQGLTNLQRVYRLIRRSGDPIFLFEERGLQTNIASAPMDALAEEIARRAKLRITDRGMAQGRGGILGAWFAAPPSWSAEPLPATRR
ncbi:MAG: hypothetical protein H7099_04465, partial [Gemmatimonadaceae bacterium]|nr:hypothetical protein [Gemmatimonadaceae bacterium]